MSDRSAKIYLTYAHADEKWAQDLSQKLQSEGYPISDLPILRDSADFMLVITTPTSVVAEGVQRDVSQFTGTIIPVIPPNVPPDINWIPHSLGLLRFIDFAQGADSAYRQLTDMLGAPPRQIVIHEPPSMPLFARIPIGLIVLLVLIAAVIGVLAMPEESSIPDEVGFGMIGIVILGLLLLLVSVLSRIRYTARHKVAIPDAFIEVIESTRFREVGRRFPIKRTFTHIGSDPQAHIRLAQKGVAPEQCRIYYDEHDDMFYLETRHPSAITTLHDRVLMTEKPLAIWNGDLILLTDQLVLQFRFGKIK